MSINAEIKSGLDPQSSVSSRTLIFIIVLIFLMSVGEGAVTPAIPLHGTALGASYRQLGFFMTGYSIAYTIMTVTAGIISDRIGRKRILLLSIAISVVASLGYCYAATPPGLLFFRILEGAGRGILWPIAEATVADNAPDDLKSKVMGRFTAAYGLGAVIGTLSGGYIMQHFYITAVFPIYPITGLVVLGTTMYGVTDKPVPSAQSVEHRKAKHHTLHTLVKLSSGADILHEIKRIWPVCLAGFAYAGFLYTTLGLLSRIAGDIGAEPRQIGYLLALFWGMRLLLFMACGEAAGVLGRKRLLLTGTGFIMLSTVIFIGATGYPHLLAAAAAGGIGSGILFTITITLIASLISPGCLGFGMGFFEFSVGIGMIMQTTLSGIIGEAVGINYTFSFVLVVAVITFLASLLYLPPDRQ